MESLKILFGKRLKQLREARGLSQEKLAEIAHCTPQHISEVERGLSGMNFDRVDRIAASFDLSQEEFFRFSALPLARD